MNGPDDRATVAFLHTAGPHQATFAGLMTRLAPEVAFYDVIDESLLAEAMAAGAIDAALSTRIGSRLEELAAGRPDLIVCTCSTIGGQAEALGAQRGLPVLRIDRGMAEQAVEQGGRILVLACIDSTLGPTIGLLEAVAAEMGRAPDITSHVIAGAWQKFLAGDRAGYLQAIAQSLQDLADRADVIVLAQASMAPALELCGDLGVAVLASPELGIRRALAVLSEKTG